MSTPSGALKDESSYFVEMIVVLYPKDLAKEAARKANVPAPIIATLSYGLAYLANAA